MGFLRDILNRPEHEHAMLVMPVGYPDENAKVPNLDRKSLGNISEFFEHG
jgi:nitroreductase